MTTRSVQLSGRWRRPAALLGLTIAVAACPDLPEVWPLLDAGSGDGGAADGPRADRPASELGPGDHAGADVSCGPGTPLYGEACGECGQYLCDLSGALICVDPGRNACGVCGELDESAGRLGVACGSCGLIECTEDGLATRCVGEHPPNVCGGCGAIPQLDDGQGGLRDKGPAGATCSSCASGTWRCSADRDDLVCQRGRGLTACGDCARCVLYHARMDQRLGGAYLKAGTLALVEDTGTDVDVGSSEAAGTNLSLVFDPLVAGPGASGLALAYVMLSPSPSGDDPGAQMLFPEFAASGDGILADPLRRYTVYSWMSLDVYRHVLIYDYFLETLISAGELIAGPPPEVPDAGVEDAARDAGAGVDAAPTDGAAPEGPLGLDASLDAGPALDVRAPDLGAEDRGFEDAAREDAGAEDRR